jgi:hypothetical protein
VRLWLVHRLPSCQVTWQEEKTVGVVVEFSVEFCGLF